jgi:hypothetical protein
MKTLIITILGFVIAVTAFSQSPVNWNFTAKKITDKTYEVHIKANVQSPWHIYLQSTPDGGPLPTKISFSKNPLIQLQGKPKENGKLVTKHEDVFGVDVKYFDGDVEFVQVVNLKNKVKTNINGTIEFMACNDEQCLPPATVKFSVMVDGRY